MTATGGDGLFRSHAGLAVGAVVVAVAVATLVPKTVEGRTSALVGVGLAALTGAVALVLKRRAVRRDLKAAVKTVGVVFGLRGVCLAAGLFGVVSRGLPAVGFVAGFFSLYFVLQWNEVSYVMAASRKGSAGGDE